MTEKILNTMPSLENILEMIKFEKFDLRFSKF